MGIKHAILEKLFGKNFFLRRIISRENQEGKHFKAAAMTALISLFSNVIHPDKIIKELAVFTSPEYYSQLQDLLHIAKVEGHELVRIGRAHDGGYIMLDDFHEGGIAYSFGISGEISWDKDAASRGYDVFMYDHTIESLPEENSRFHFFKLGISDGRTQDELLKTLEYLIAQNHHEQEHNMILKMDVEGTEWGFLECVSSEVLKQFNQMTFEFHALINPENPELVLQVFRKINRTHQLIHLHANNNCDYVLINGKKFCDLLECTYVIREKYKINADYDVTLPLSVDAQNVEDYPEIELGKWNEKVEVNNRIRTAIRTI